VLCFQFILLHASVLCTIKDYYTVWYNLCSDNIIVTLSARECMKSY